MDKARFYKKFSELLIFTSLVVVVSLNAQSDIQRSGTHYAEQMGDAKASLTYWEAETGTDLLFKAEGRPNLDIQCELLNRLLTKVLGDHPADSKFGVALGSMQECFMPLLQRVLISSKEWDATRGRPRNGERMGNFLTNTINQHGVFSPVAKVFQEHGFSLIALGVNRIEIHRIPALKDARLPTYIWEMNFLAQRQ